MIQESQIGAWSWFESKWADQKWIILMKAHELITILRRYDPEIDVVVETDNGPVMFFLAEVYDKEVWGKQKVVIDIK